jgi:Na+/melibiose symporter-like transporter
MDPKRYTTLIGSRFASSSNSSLFWQILVADRTTFKFRALIKMNFKNGKEEFNKNVPYSYFLKIIFETILRTDCMLTTNGAKFFTRFMILQVILMGVLYTAAQVFGLIESQMFNTYLTHVLHLEAIFVTIMVIFSALVGLITNIIFGIMSDNTRSRFGRRRPFILFGGFLAGISMIMYAYSGSFVMALIIDAIAIGAASNSYYVAQRALIPDLIDINHRGRVNGIINNFGTIGYGVGIALFFLISKFYGIPDGEEGTIITQAGYIFALTIGGILFILVALIGFIGIKEIKASKLPPKRSFTQEFK